MAQERFVQVPSSHEYGGDHVPEHTAGRVSAVKPAPAADAAYERKMRLYGYLAEHERWQPLRVIMTRVLGYLDAEAVRAIEATDITPPEHRAAFATGRKKLERDLKDLAALGIEVESREVISPTSGETTIGYRLARRSYSSRRIDLTNDQVAILNVAAALAKSAADNPIGEDALAAVEKLVPGADLGRGLPLSVSFRVPATERNADVITRRLHRLAEIMRRRHVVEFDYRKLDDTESRRLVELFGIGERMGLWYAVGRDLGDGRVKSFRVSRMVGRPAEIAAEQGPRYQIPADFDVADHIVPPWMIGTDGSEVEVAFAPNVAHLAYAMLPGVVPEEVGDGRVRFRVWVRNVDGLVRWLMTFGDAVEVLGPDAARAYAADMRTAMEANRG